MPSILKLPTFQNFKVDPRALLAASGASMLSALNTRRCRDLSYLGALATTLRDDPISICNELGRDLQSSLEQGVICWVGSATQAQLTDWKEVFGEDVVSVVGPWQQVTAAHRNPDADDVRINADEMRAPIVLRPGRLAIMLAQNAKFRPYLIKTLEGLDTLRMHHEEAEILEHAGVGLRLRSAWERWLRDPTVIAYVVVLIYSALRVLPVHFVPEFEGSLWMLWTLDITTAIPYTWGVVTMVAGATLKKRLIGLVVTLVTFLAPYVYFWFHGEHYPPVVVVTICVLLFGGMLIEAVKYVRNRKLSFGLLKQA